ncbi:Rad1/Rec1/Rad17 [Syncephalis plumigaleata]|nr:Rad1/Rec1/Rad17 [Syncephalis plumigaleata]
MACLEAKITGIQPIYMLAKAVHFKELATCTVTNDGIKFSVEDSGCLQAFAYLQKELFQQYTFRPPPQGEAYIFGINLSVLVLFLAPLNVVDQQSGGRSSIDGRSSGMRRGTLGGVGMRGSHSLLPSGPNNSLIIRLQENEELNLTLEENGVIMTCQLQGIEMEELPYFDIHQSPLCYKVIMQSDWLRDALIQAIEICDLVTITASTEPAFLNISAEGITGSTEASFNPNVDIIESFSSVDYNRCRYRSNHLKTALEALSLSNKASIRANQDGLLGLQMMISCENTNRTAYVEFRLLPVIEHHN